MRRRTCRTRRAAIGWLVVLCAAAAEPACAEVKLHRMFSSGAVLQQGMKVPIFGSGDVEGDTVSVRIQDFHAVGVVNNGRWRVEIGPLKPGGPFQMTVTGGKLIAILDVLVGEVWVCAGGTNMQWTVLRSQGFGGVMSHEGNRHLRLYSAKREGALEPRWTSDVTWTPAGAASVGTFSAVGYYFGRELQPHVNVPIGLISCNHYDSTIESWISREALAASPALKASLEKPINAFETKSPTVLFNAMVSPLTQYAVRGVLWYHGETSVEQAYEYRTALATLITDWRKQWNQPNLPFIIVQHAPYKPISKFYKESKLAELRESQFVVTRQMPNTAPVVITDYGDQFDLHPPQKEPVGRRAAIVARGAVYGEKIEYLGPTFVGANFAGSEATLKFEHVGGGLQAKEGELAGFIIAGSDRMFYDGKAVIQGQNVVVTAKEVTNPAAVRYGWADYPTGNLVNKEGLPASPFRTDNFPLLSQPKAAE